MFTTKNYFTQGYKKQVTRIFPGLSYELINHHLPKSTATHKGHMVRQHQGHQSTQNQQKAILNARAQVGDMHPPEQVCNVEDKEIFCYAVLADSNEGTVYSDLTGKFPVQSFKGNQYIFVCYVYATNENVLVAFETLYWKISS